MWRAQRHPLLAVVVIGILGIWLVSGCEQGAVIRPPYTEKILVPKVLAVPAGDYTSAAWLADDQLAFVYESSTNSPLNDYYIALYSEQEAKWQPIEKIQPEECLPVYYRQLNRLPDGGLGFLVDCNTEPVGFHYSTFGHFSMPPAN